MYADIFAVMSIELSATPCRLKRQRATSAGTLGFAETPDGAITRSLQGVDEAAQATEPETIVGLCQAELGARVVCIGDHMQLPPTVRDRWVAYAGLEHSLFQRLTEKHGFNTYLLRRQYRMHPSISRFPSERFYNSGVSDDASVLHRPHTASSLSLIHI